MDGIRCNPTTDHIDDSCNEQRQPCKNKPPRRVKCHAGKQHKTPSKTRRQQPEKSDSCAEQNQVRDRIKRHQKIFPPLGRTGTRLRNALDRFHDKFHVIEIFRLQRFRRNNDVQFFFE